MKTREIEPRLSVYSLGREAYMKKIWLLAVFLVIGSAVGSTQTTEELINDGRNPENVTTQSMGFSRQSYSPLKQINKSNIKKLVPISSGRSSTLSPA